MTKLEILQMYIDDLNSQVAQSPARDNRIAMLIDERNKAINYSQCCTQLPIKELPNCNRVEVIDQKGRSYVNWKPNNKVRLSMQDDGRTAKIFID